MRKRRVNLIDNWSESVVITDVSFAKESWMDHPTVNINISLSDCHRKVSWMEFGDTEKDALRKIDNVINILEAARSDVEKAYKAQEAYRIKHPQKEKENA